jgi:sortase (surface protein transpeptidase)
VQPTPWTESDSWLAIESPEFAVRFGRLLTTTRRRSKSSITKLAASKLVRFDASQLRQFEQGVSTIDESIVEALCLLYSADLGRVLPQRLPVMISGRCLSCAGTSVRFSTDDPTSLMVAYLRLIRRLRNQKQTPAVALRRDDVLVLARYLDIDGAEVVERLSTLMKVSAAQRNTMAMLFATGAIVIGVTAGGFVSADVATTGADVPGSSVEHEVVATIPADVPVDLPVAPPASAPAAENAPTITEPTTAENVDPELVVALSDPVPEPEVVGDTALIGTASIGTIAQGAEVVGLPTATRMQEQEQEQEPAYPLAPAVAPPLTVAAEGPPPNQSGCNPDPSAAVMSVFIPDIAYTCPVYAGGQPMIDAGFVTLVTDEGRNPVLAGRPGDPGTLWLAGHRSSHGAAFSKVPDLADGALISVSSGGVTATYRVVARSYVEVRGGRVLDASGMPTAEATWQSIIRSDFSGNLAPRLVLQTCEGDHFRWMIYADLVN